MGTMSRDDTEITLYSTRTLDTLFRVSDALCIVVGFWFAADVFPRVNVDGSLFLATAITCLVFLLVGELTGLYRGWRGVATYREVAAACLNWLYSLGVLLAVGFLTRYTDQLSRLALAVAAAAIMVLLIKSRLAVRALQRWYRTHGYGIRRFAIAGVNELGIRLARNLEDSPELGHGVLQISLASDRVVQFP